jgi:hypothetical protein
MKIVISLTKFLELGSFGGPCRSGSEPRKDAHTLFELGLQQAHAGANLHLPVLI